MSLHVVYPARPRYARPASRELLLEALPETTDVESMHEGSSGAQVYRVRLRDGTTRVVKHVRPASDWLMRATRDPGREALLWHAGVYDSLPPQVECPVVSAREVEDGWLLVMRDVEPALQAFGRDPSRHAVTVLDALSRLHAPELRDDLPMLCTCADRLRIFSPLQAYVAWREPDTIPKTLPRMWQTFAELPAADVVDAVFSCVEDPAPLLARIAEQPHRLLHGDVRLPNLGAGGRAIVIVDWALACAGPAELEIVWFVCDATLWCDAEPAELIERYSRASGVPLDAQALDLAFVFQAAMGEVAYLAHELVQRPAGADRLTAERVAWWLDRVRLAFERLGL